MISRKNIYRIVSLVFLFLCSVISSLDSSSFPKPPEQPASGPGGKDYKHSEVIKNVYGKGGKEYWIFEPSSPFPESAPVIVFNHGWGGINPKIYGAWIEHLVRRGNIVIYPRYQADLKTPTRDFTINAVEAVKTAIKELQSGKHVRPELDKVGIAGHSAGGQVSANMAALAKEKGIPAHKVVMCIQPGKSWNRLQRINIVLEDLRKIPQGTLLVTVAGDMDRVVKDIDAKRIFKESANVPDKNKDFIILVSDAHGEPELKASHFAPCAVDERYDSGEKMKRPKRGRRPALSGMIRERIKDRVLEKRDIDFDNLENQAVPDSQELPNSVNALDYYGLWKIFDALCEAGFYDRGIDKALGNTPEQRFMGVWSDGVPVKELVVIDNVDDI